MQTRHFLVTAPNQWPETVIDRTLQISLRQQRAFG
jgi:hypothetical protein